jgi:hypothetical protein
MIEKNSGKYPHWMIQKINVPSLKKLFRDGQVNEDKLEHIENVIGLKKIAWKLYVILFLRSIFERKVKKIQSCIICDIILYLFSKAIVDKYLD